MTLSLRLILLDAACRRCCRCERHLLQSGGVAYGQILSLLVLFLPIGRVSVMNGECVGTAMLAVNSCIIQVYVLLR